MIELNTIYNEDCMEGMKRIPDSSVDCIICDLPYGTTACKWDTIIPFDKLWEQYNRIIKDNGAICLFGTEPFSSKLRLSNLNMYRYDWIWEKTRYTNFYFVKKQPAKKHEIISVFYKRQPTYNPQMKEGLPYRDCRSKTKRHSDLVKVSLDRTPIVENKGVRYPSSVLKFSNPNNNNYHPTQKPVPLIEYLIKTYSNEGEIILDNCIGSGTTALACIDTGRNFIGFEKEKKYFDIAMKRIAQMRQQPKLDF